MPDGALPVVPLQVGYASNLKILGLWKPETEHANTSYLTRGYTNDPTVDLHFPAYPVRLRFTASPAGVAILGIGFVLDVPPSGEPTRHDRIGPCSADGGFVLEQDIPKTGLSWISVLDHGYGHRQADPPGYLFRVWVTDGETESSFDPRIRNLGETLPAWKRFWRFLMGS